MDASKPQRLGPVAITLFAVAALVPFAALAYAGSIWDRIPARVPTHFDGSFRADGWTTKGPALVGLLVGLPLGIVALVGLVALFSLRAPIRARGTADTELTIGVVRAQRDTIGTWLGVIALAVSLSVTVTSLVSIHAGGPSQVRASVLLAVALILLSVVASSVAVIRAGRRAATQDDGSIEVDAVWKGGLIYVNRDDPALFVEKRVGIGMTINFGHPAGRVIGIGLVLLTLLGLVLALSPMV